MIAIPLFDQQLQIYAPVDQAQRCIDIWLKEEGRSLRQRDKKRLAGLVARYFYYEEDLNDQLMLSFLRHYSGNKVIDMEDPAAVREEIHAILEKSSVGHGRDISYHVLLVVTTILLFMAVCFTVVEIIHLPMTTAQQQSLKSRVQDISARRVGLAPSTIWARVKKPLGVKSYQDITFWQYDDAMAQLDLIAAP